MSAPLSSTKCMVLKPKDLSFFELFLVLFERDFHGKVVFCLGFDVMKPKWRIFTSLLTQKILLSTADILKCIGDTIEFLLNELAATHNNLLMLLFNSIRGKRLVKKNSEKYASIVSLLDKRVGLLDSSTKIVDPDRYNAALCMMASKVSYENEKYVRNVVENEWKMEVIEYGDYWNEYQEKDTTQAFIMLDKSEDRHTYVVAFRGTEAFDANAWATDVDISWVEIPGVGRTHAGFMKALGFPLVNKEELIWPKKITTTENHARAYYSIRDLLNDHLQKDDKAKFILTGHSLGGALAILFTAMLMLHDETYLLERLEGVYTFGQPRVGDTDFANYMDRNLERHGIKYLRFVYCNDIVPRLPFDDDILKFDHFGTCLYYDRSYKLTVMQDEPNKNYFSWKAMIPKKVNAFWELVRSFTITYKNGPEYEEGWLQKFFRLFGLVFAGLPAHGPQDYVNITRLGLLPSDLD